MEGGCSLYVTTHRGLCGHKYCGNGDKIFLIYQVALRDHVFKELET